jgi:hypothetical protein
MQDALRDGSQPPINLIDERANRDPCRVVEVFLDGRPTAKDDFFDASRIDVEFDHVAPFHYYKGDEGEKT